MAKARANCTCATCGAEFVYEKICYNRREADDFEAWASDHITECTDCYRARMARERQERAEQHRAENEASAEKSEMIGLPELEGTEKQKAWASTIRLEWIAWAERRINEAIEAADDYRDDPADSEKVTALEADAEQYKATLEWAKHNIVTASYWIDNRNMPSMIWRLARSRAAEDTDEAREAAAKAEAEAKANAEQEAAEKAERDANATIAPEGVENPVIATIRADGDTVTVSSDKDEKLREIVKDCGMSWDKSRWTLKTRSIINESADNLAAYIGNRLLRAGFAIRIFDNDILDAAVEGTAEPRAKRVLSRKGDHFRLEWEGKDDDIYSAGRKLKGAKYEDHGFSIPFSSWRMAFDLAELNGVAVSNGAKTAAEEYQNAIVNKKKAAKPTPKKTQAAQLSDVLENNDGVIADLMDDE